jgi:hypothetical protein
MHINLLLLEENGAGARPTHIMHVVHTATDRMHCNILCRVMISVSLLTRFAFILMECLIASMDQCTCELSTLLN